MTLSASVAELVGWYRQNRRELPWRASTDAYRVLLSELMLQQTRVETVIPYFERFVARWPTLEAFAAASEDEVLAAWAGLGYYSRARNLHRAARAAAALGGLPGDVDALRALPGVGPYTAGAVASIAFGVPAPAVDGNVERVMTRRLGSSVDPKSTAGRRLVFDAVAALHAHTDAPGDLTQALMELGATVCTPRRPACGACPWWAGCAAAAAGSPEAFPVRAPKAAPRVERAVAALVWRGPELLMGRRGPGLLAGMWEPVLGAAPAEVSRARLREHVAPVVGARAGVQIRVDRDLGDVVHVFTHVRLTVSVFAATEVGSAGAADDTYAEIAWVNPAHRGDRAFSRLGEKLIDLAAHGSPLLDLAAEPGVLG